MKITLFVLATVAAGIAMAGPALAQNYPWCAYYDNGEDQSINCGFVSHDQCMASVSGIGGFCMPNNTYQPLKPPRRG